MFFEGNQTITINNVIRRTVPHSGCSDRERLLGDLQCAFSGRSGPDLQKNLKIILR